MERFKNLIRKAIAVDAEKIIVYAGQKPALCQNQQVSIAEDQEAFDEKLFSNIFKTVLPKKDRAELTEPAEGMINIPGLGKLCVIGLSQDPAIILYMPKATNEAKSDLANLEQFKKSWPYFASDEAELNLEDAADLSFSVDLPESSEDPVAEMPADLPTELPPDLPAPPMQMANPIQMASPMQMPAPEAEVQESIDPAADGFNFAMATGTNVDENLEASEGVEGTNAEASDPSMGLGGLAWGDSLPAEMLSPEETSEEDSENDVAGVEIPEAEAAIEAPAFTLPPPDELAPEVESFPEESNEFAGLSDQDFNNVEGLAAANLNPNPGTLPMPPRNHQANQIQFEMPSHEVAPIQQAPREIDYGPDDPTLNGQYTKVMIDDLLIQMINMKSSDLHLTLGQKIIYRIDGEITRIDSDVVTPEVMRDLLDPIMPARNRAEFLECNDTDFAYAIPEIGRFRVNIFRDRNGVGSVIRHIPSKIMTMEQLKVPPVCRTFCDLSKGLVLVTGPTGSGKSTTLAAMLDHINRTRSDHLITVEDPIEFVHPQIKCLVNQREVHRHTQSFSRALRAALREDPDIVLIGEMRDLETIAIAIETAETGHLVFGTLHTTTAVSTVDRIIDQFPADRQEQIRMMLSSSLKGVVSQTLVKKIGGGRVAAQEILVTDDAVAAMIREGKNHMINNHLATQKSAGNQLLNTALLQHVQAGNITADDAYLKSVDKKGMIAALQRANIKFNPPSETLKAS